MEAVAEGGGRGRETGPVGELSDELSPDQFNIEGEVRLTSRILSKDQERVFRRRWTEDSRSHVRKAFDHTASSSASHRGYDTFHAIDMIGSEVRIVVDHASLGCHRARRSSITRRIPSTEVLISFEWKSSGHATGGRLLKQASILSAVNF